MVARLPTNKRRGGKKQSRRGKERWGKLGGPVMMSPPDHRVQESVKKRHQGSRKTKRKNRRNTSLFSPASHQRGREAKRMGADGPEKTRMGLLRAGNRTTPKGCRRRDKHWGETVEETEGGAKGGRRVANGPSGQRACRRLCPEEKATERRAQGGVVFSGKISCVFKWGCGTRT